MGTVLLIFVICLMVVFILLAFIQKSNNTIEELPILTPDEINQIKEKDNDKNL